MSEILPYSMVDGIRCFSPEVASDYSDYPDSGFDLTDENEAKSFWVQSRNRLFKNIILTYAKPDKTTKFLEIGCGTGSFIKTLVANKNLEITGSEIYLKGLVYAKKNLSNVDFVQFDVTKGKISENFDMIAAFDVIEHIEDDLTALENIRQMLGPEGTVVISVPQHKFMWSRLDEIVKHKRRYSRRELLTKLKNSGFDIRFCTSFVFILFPLMMISRVFDKSAKPQQSEAVELENKVKFSGPMNFIFDFFMKIDEALIRLGISLPFGGTLLVVARKQNKL